MAKKVAEVIGIFVRRSKDAGMYSFGFGGEPVFQLIDQEVYYLRSDLKDCEKIAELLRNDPDLSELASDPAYSASDSDPE